MDILNGKTVIVMGVANKNSIAWGCAQAIMASGGKVVLTYQNDRLRKSLLRFVDPDQPMVQCDVADEATLTRPSLVFVSNMVPSTASSTQLRTPIRKVWKTMSCKSARRGTTWLRTSVRTRFWRSRAARCGFSPNSVAC